MALVIVIMSFPKTQFITFSKIQYDSVAGFFVKIKSATIFQ